MVFAVGEKRKHIRFNPKGLTADIVIVPPGSDKEFTLRGTVVDMCYTGIKIKLDFPMPCDITESTMKIKLTIPEIDLPISITGTIKHLNDESEYGVHYLSNHQEHQIDDLMFECIKYAPHHDEHQKAYG